MTARPKRRPERVPPAVWAHAEKFRSGEFRASPIELAKLDRLLSPEAGPLWADLLAQGVQHDDQQSWGILVDHFLATIPGVGRFNPKLPDKLRATRDRQHQIAERAEELADLLLEHEDEANQAGVSCPLELTGVVSLLEAAGWLPPPFRPWEKADLERSLQYLKPAALLWEIAQAARDEQKQPTPLFPDQAYATKGNNAPVRKWVWQTDAVFRLSVAHQIEPRTVWIGHETKALLARLILHEGVTADMVRKAREAAPDPLPSDETVIFYRSRNDNRTD